MLKKTLLTAAAALAIITGATAISTPEAKAGVSISWGGWGGFVGCVSSYLSPRLDTDLGSGPKFRHFLGTCTGSRSFLFF